MNRDVIGMSESDGTGDSSNGVCIGMSGSDGTGGSSSGVCIGLSWSGSGSGSLKSSMDENPRR